MNTKMIERLAAFNSYTGAMVARSQGKATAEHLETLRATCGGKVPSKSEALGAVKAMIAQGGF